MSARRASAVDDGAQPGAVGPVLVISASRSSGLTVAIDSRVSSSISSDGTSQLTSNSMPSGSLAYSAFVVSGPTRRRARPCGSAARRPAGARPASRLPTPGGTGRPRRGPPGCRRPSSDGEQPEIVVVVGVRHLQERGARKLHPDRESERFFVELHASVDVADVQHCVVESLDGHMAVNEHRRRWYSPMPRGPRPTGDRTWPAGRRRRLCLPP